MLDPGAKMKWRPPLPTPTPTRSKNNVLPPFGEYRYYDTTPKKTWKSKIIQT